jgi:hypothetical protein
LLLLSPSLSPCDHSLCASVFMSFPFMIHGCVCVSWEGKKGGFDWRELMWMGFGMSFWVGS